MPRPLEPVGAGGLGLRRLLGTLKFKVVLVSLASALVAGLASTYFVTGQSADAASAVLLEQQTGEVALVADMLDTGAAQAQLALRVFSSRITPELLRNSSQLQAYVQPSVQPLLSFAELSIAGADGQVMARFVNPQARAPISDLSGDEQFRRTLTGAAPLVGDTVADFSAGRVALTYTMPVLGEADAVLAVVRGVYRFDPKTLLPSRPALQSGHSKLIVYSRSGLIISHPDKARLLGDIKDEPGLQTLHAAWLAAGRPVTQAATGSITPDFILSQAGAELPHWMVARVSTHAAAVGPLRGVIRGSWMIVLGTTTFCAVVSGLLILRMTRPMSQLRDRARQILQGNIPADHGWPQVDGEIGDLTEVFRQVTVSLDQALRSQTEMVDQLRAILNNASVGILFTLDGRFRLIGRHLCLLLGYEPQELLGQLVRMIYPSDQAYAEIGVRVREAFRGGGHFDGELPLLCKDGTSFWAHMLGRSVLTDDPAGGTIWIVEDITLARVAREQLSWSATHDSLTHLPNRREFEARLAHALNQFDGRDICVMFIDLDRFKVINDTAGHATGDEVLRQVSRLLEAQVRQSDSVGRLGGDEFAVLLPGCSLARAQAIAELMRGAVHDWRLERGAEVFSLGASIGVVAVTPALADLKAVLHAADQACYAAKRRGRNCVVLYEHDSGAAPLAAV